MDEDEAYPSDNIKLYSCAICGRNFKAESIRKHQVVCQKTASKKRKIFDSGKQRAENSDVIYEKTRETKGVQIFGEKPQDEKPPRSNWRQKHNELIKAIKQAREVTVAMKTGAPLPAFQPSAIPSDYVQCNFCGRSFNQSAAQRHIPFCEQQHKRQKMNNSANNKAQQAAKSKYQAPLPGAGRKQSSEYNNGYGGSQSYLNSGYSTSNGTLNSNGSGGINRGYNGNNSFKSQSGGGVRKPVKYDSNLYNDRDSRDHEPSSNRVVYAIRNKSQTRIQQQDESLLRTGRNYENNEKNSLARKRSGNNGYQSSPMNSRKSSATKTLTKRSPSPAQNRYGYSRSNGNVQQQQQQQSKVSKFCTDCGTQFPVEWAKYCCLCGCRRH